MSSINLLHSGLTLSVGSALNALLSFARNIVIANLISVEDFGVAATFALTMSFVEMTSYLAVDRLLIQAKDGDAYDYQNAAHGFEVIRGIVNSLILFFLAAPVAYLFNLPELIWAYQILAIGPFIRSFTHLDIIRFQREMNFLPYVATEIVPQLLALIAVPIIAIYQNDFRIMLWVVIGQIFSRVVLSHLLAQRRYRWFWSKERFREIINFGWPLLINGLLLFGIFQADKAIVGATIGMVELGWFSAVFSLALFPSMVLAQICQSFLLPLLSKRQSNMKEFSLSANATIQICAICGALLTVGISFGGPSLLILVFGERYAQGVDVIIWLGLMQGFRLLKAGPIIVAISQGNTKIPPITNIIRSVAILLALFSVWIGWGIIGIAISGVIGEMLASICAFHLIRSKLNIDIIGTHGKIILAMLAGIISVFLSDRLIDGHNILFEFTICSLALIITFGGLLLLMPDCLKWLKKVAREND